MTKNIHEFSALTFDCYGTLIDWESGIWDALQPLFPMLMKFVNLMALQLDKCCPTGETVNGHGMGRVWIHELDFAK